eukprot:COSAG06_NODE_511_length_14869_cov_115.791063_6_plen_205_part_00
MMKLALAALAAALPHAATAENSECSITNTPSCPSGKVLILGEGCMSDCDDGAAGVQNDCDDFCDAGRCCQTPHVLTGTELTADATTNGVAAALTNTGYEVTWERYSDATCTTAKAEFVGGLPISGRSATCIAQVNDPDNDPTNFGWYGYCPGETGKGYVEYIVTMGEGQASPTPSASCPSGGATGKGSASARPRAILRWIACKS